MYVTVIPIILPLSYFAGRNSDHLHSPPITSRGLVESIPVQVARAFPRIGIYKAYEDFTSEVGTPVSISAFFMIRLRS